MQSPSHLYVNFYMLGLTSPFSVRGGFWEIRLLDGAAVTVAAIIEGVLVDAAMMGLETPLLKWSC